MKTRLLPLFLGLALVIVPGVRAEDAKPAAGAKAEKPGTELEGVMKKMSRTWRTIRTQARDGKFDAKSAELVASVRAGAEKSATLTPAFAAEQPADKRAKFSADYQAQMKKLVEELAKIEAALKAGDNEGAKKLVAAVGDIMKSGHKEFQKPDEKK